MLEKGAARKVAILIHEDSPDHLNSLCDAILKFLLDRGVPAATATRAAAGFGAHHAIHETRVVPLTEHRPLRIEFIDSAEKVDELVRVLCDMITDGVIEVQDTHIIKVAPPRPGTCPPKPSA